MPGDIRETDNHSSIGEGCPVKVIAPGIIGRLVPTGNIEARDLRPFLREEVTAGWNALPAGRAGRPPASAWFLPHEELIGHAYGSPRNRACNQSPKKQRYCIKADASLRDGSWHTGNGRPPTEVQSRTNIGNGSDDTGENADTKGSTSAWTI